MLGQARVTVTASALVFPFLVWTTMSNPGELAQEGQEGPIVEQLKLIQSRLDRLELSASNPTTRASLLHSRGLPRGPGGLATQQLDPTEVDTDSAVEDIAGEFAAIKDYVQRVKLPADLRLNDANKQGIRRKEQPAANMLIKSA